MQQINNILKENSIKNLFHIYEKNYNIKKMIKYKQHKNTSTYEHSLHVAIISYKISTFFHMKEDNKKDILVGAILHDFALYDWRQYNKKYLHLWRHPKMALQNSKDLFNLNIKQENIIISHMFPLTILHVPKCKEAVIVNIADKICTVKEILNYTYTTSYISK